MVLTDKVLEQFYLSLVRGDLDRAKAVHIPHSHVFYVREHLKSVFGETFSLDYVERCLFLEGMLERKDVFEPERVREWELDGFVRNQRDKNPPVGERGGKPQGRD